MAAIDIGAAATDRAYPWSPGYTVIALDNPANESGKITSVEIWAVQNLSGCKVGTFIQNGVAFTPRDYATIGDVTAGAKRTFPGLDIDVEAGEFIGLYYSAGNLEYDSTGGQGLYYKSGDQFDAGPQTYTLQSSAVMSLYAEGEVANVTVTPTTLSLTLTTYAPSIVINTIVTPSTLSLALTGYAPVLKEVLTPGKLGLTLTTYAPMVHTGSLTTITPTTLSLTLTTYAPTVTFTENALITPTTLSLTLTSYAPILKEVITPATLNLVLTTYAPSIISGTAITPSTLSLILTTYIPAINILGRRLIVRVITSRYREINAITTQNRQVQAITTKGG